MMRLALASCLLVLFAASSVRSQLVIPQIPTELNALIAVLPDIIAFVDKIPSIAPQLVNVLSSTEFQNFKDKVIQIIISQVAQHGGIQGVKDKLEGLLAQVLGSKPQAARIDWDPILNNLINSIPGAALGLLGGVGGIISGIGSLFGKRSIEEGRGLDDILALADKLQVNTLFPLIAQLVPADKLQQLQTQLLNVALGVIGNNWNLATVSQLLQQIVTGLVPETARIDIDWDKLGQSVLETAATYVLPGLVGLISIFGKRDVTARINYQQLLSSLPTQQLAQIAQVVLNAKRDIVSKVLAHVKALLQQFLPQQRGRVNFDDLSDFVLQSVNNILPNLGQNILSAIFD